MPRCGSAISQKAGGERRRVDDAHTSLRGKRQYPQELSVVQAIVVVHQRSVYLQRRENAHPKIHGINAKAYAPDAPFPLQLLYCVVSLGKRPFGVFPILIFDVVDMNEIEVVDTQAGGTLVQ